MTSGYQGHDIADAFECRSSLKEFDPYSCLFVSIGVSSSFPSRKRLAVYPVHPVHPCSM